MRDRIDIPSLIFSDPQYYDGFTKRRKIRQKIVCDEILTLFRRKMTVAKSEFSSSAAQGVLGSTKRVVTKVANNSELLQYVENNYKEMLRQK